MKKILIPIIICLGILSMVSINEANASTVAKLVVCNNDPTQCPNTNMTIQFPIITNGIVSTMHFGDCANNQILKYQSSNTTWICGTDNTGGGLTSINGDITAAQTLTGQSTNITATTSSGTTTFKLGTNIPVLGGSAQIFTKTISFSSGNKLTLTPSASTAGINIGTTSTFQTSPRQGDLSIAGSLLKYNDNSNTTQTIGILSQAQTWLAKQTGTITASTASFNLGTLASDLTSPRQGDLRIIGSSLKYNDNTNTTQTITPSSYLTTAVTSATGTSNNVTVSASTGAVTWNLGSNVVTTGGSAQSFSKNINFGATTDTFANYGLIIRNTAGSQAYTLQGQAITANRTINLGIPIDKVSVSYQPVYNFTQQGNKTGTNVAGFVMFGGYATLTPRYSANATVTVTGYGYNSIAGSGCVLRVYTGTSFLGNNNNGLIAGATGVGGDLRFASSTAQGNQTFTKSVVVTGLSSGQKNYFDLAFGRTTSGYCKLLNVDWLVKEQ